MSNGGGKPVLPTEVVLVILRHLPLSARVQARLVCSTWAHILDTDHRAWSNITFLESLEPGTKSEPINGSHGGWLNQVHETELTAAISFLIQRKARITALELNQKERQSAAVIEQLPTLLQNSGIHLKAFAYRQFYCPPTFENDTENALIKLIQSQPSLERLYLHVPEGISYLPSLPNLRILSLDFHPTYINPSKYCLADLRGLRLCAGPWTGYDGRLTEVFSRQIRPELRLAASSGQVYCPCNRYSYRFTVAVWGTEELSPEEATFLLQPPHYSDTGKIISHHRI